MGIPLVGKRHQRKAGTSQTVDRKLDAILNRICGASGSGRSSANNQQSIQPQESSSDNCEHIVGTLLSRGAARQGDVHARRIHGVCKELDSPALGQLAVGRSKDRRGGAVASSSGFGGWDQRQNQMRNVGFVFSCRSLGDLRSQPHLLGNSSLIWRKERSKHRRSRQRKTSRSAPVLITRVSVAWSYETRISGPVARVSGWSVGNTSRRARRPALVRLQLRQHELQRSTFVLWRRGGHLKTAKTEASAKVLPMHLAMKDALLGWMPQSDYNGPGDFVFPSHRHKGKKPLDLAAVLKRKIQPAFTKVGITGVGWHTFRHTVGTMLAEMGEHQLRIRDYLRYSNLHVTNKYLQATPESKRLAQGKLVDAILPGVRCRRGNQLWCSRWCWSVRSRICSREGAAERVLRCLLDPNGPRFFSGVFVSA
jgi:hypothetical protein